MIALAVGLQAQQVGGQEKLDRIRSEMAEASQKQVELRAQVAEAESPANILAEATKLGMVPAATVLAVPAPVPTTDIHGTGTDRG